MKKYRARLMFYSISNSEEECVAVKKLRRFLRNENVRPVAEQHTYNVRNFYYAGELLIKIKEDSPEKQVEHRYEIFLEKRDLCKLHGLVVLLQTYGEYIGFYNSRILHFGRQD